MCVVVALRVYVGVCSKRCCDSVRGLFTVVTFVSTFATEAFVSHCASLAPTIHRA